MQTRYYPPEISHDWLTEETLRLYPSHRTCRSYIENAVAEYIKFWRLIVSYPDMRIVAPCTILAVHRVHWLHREIYFADCMQYFNRYLFEEMAWGGRSDITGTMETARSYIDLYDEQPSDPWHDLMYEYNLGHSFLYVVQ